MNFINSVKTAFPDFFLNKKVLEVGSLDINGSIRSSFERCDYKGIDLQKGKGVDVVASGQEADFASSSFDVTISCNCFEHNPFWLETFLNMCRMTKSGGLILVTSAGYGFEEHGTSRTSPEDSPFTTEWDYYRNLGERDFIKKINLSNWFSSWFFVHYKESKDLYFIGQKKTNNPLNLKVIESSYSLDIYGFASSKLGHLVNDYYIFKKVLKKYRRCLKGYFHK